MRKLLSFTLMKNWLPLDRFSGFDGPPVRAVATVPRLWLCLISASRFAGVMFLPPAVMMMSFLRPVIDR